MARHAKPEDESAEERFDVVDAETEDLPPEDTGFATPPLEGPGTP